MNVLLLILQSDKNQIWLEWCKSHYPNAPCDIPPGADFSLAMIICVFIAVLIAVTAIFHAISRLRISTPEEFREANNRLSNGREMVVPLKGRRLRQHCRLISRDVIQITGFAGRHVSICFHGHHSDYAQNREKRAAMMLFMDENKSLRSDGIVIAILYYLPLMIRPLVKQTKSAMDRYSAMWLPLFEQYTIENPECQRYF
jgi:hypothetical protein